MGCIGFHPFGSYDIARGSRPKNLQLRSKGLRVKSGTTEFIVHTHAQVAEDHISSESLSRSENLPEIETRCVTLGVQLTVA